MTSASRRVRLTAPLIATFLLTGGLTAWSLGQGQAEAATPAAEKAAAKAADDFNGDGHADLVVGAPGGTVSGKKQAGYVAVTYGSKDGLDPAKKKIISRSTSGVPGSATAKQEFGRFVTKGDLDRDGYTDLVIGAGAKGAAAGAVILWGARSGLTGGTRIATYGHAPQAGDFDGDGKTDLALFGAVGSYGDDPIAHRAQLWKGPLARTGTPVKKLDFMEKSQWSSYDDDERPSPACVQNHDVCIDGPGSVNGPVFPQAVGDFNGDGRADIVMNDYAGDGMWSNSVLYGSADGFERGSAPGSRGALAVGDINGDHVDDVVSGSNGYEDNKVTVAYGSADGLKDEQWFDQNLPGVPGAEEEGDAFGSSLAVGDVTGDGHADIAVGVPGEDVGSVADAGSVVLVRGSAAGVTGTGAQAFHQNTAGVPGVAERGDEFGAATALLDVDGDGRSDLAASSVHENADAGAVWSLRGTATGLTATKSVAFGPKDLSAPSVAALFGSTLR
ncbi:FG-GAP-like repeat-containing protein [Streptomyces aureocirculatus]|uniref:FG-GAP-like repeat-containing protein n=1 Tax=Streptomyces aureocirculatus TaxID=67275 RepID=UPI0004C48BF5|nr:FG-GAP-like repeat-containing protein [Streptomyces aureocirculatus]